MALLQQEQETNGNGMVAYTDKWYGVTLMLPLVVSAAASIALARCPPL